MRHFGAPLIRHILPFIYRVLPQSRKRRTSSSRLAGDRRKCPWGKNSEPQFAQPRINRDALKYALPCLYRKRLLKETLNKSNYFKRTYSGLPQAILRNVHGISSTTITQNYCFRLDDLKRRIAILRNDLRSFSLGQ